MLSRSTFYDPVRQPTTTDPCLTTSGLISSYNMKQRGGSNVAPPGTAATLSLLCPEVPVNHDAPGGPATTSFNPPSRFAWTPSAAPASENVPRCGERRCRAFRIDAGQPGTTTAGGTPQRLILVTKLGKCDTSVHYKRNAVTINDRGSTWRVWLNVSPAVVKGTKGSMPRIWLDWEGHWRSGGNAAVDPKLQDYVDFCGAANRTKTLPRAVAISR